MTTRVPPRGLVQIQDDQKVAQGGRPRVQRDVGRPGGDDNLKTGHALDTFVFHCCHMSHVSDFGPCWTQVGTFGPARYAFNEVGSYSGTEVHLGATGVDFATFGAR